MNARLLLLAALMLGAASGRAATLPDLTLEEKVDQSDSVVRAECVSVRSEWVQNRIVTKAQFNVRDDFTQRGMRQIEVTTAGGVAVHPKLKVRLRSVVSEQPEIQVRDEAILFTRRMPSGERLLVGGRQGYMRVTQGSGDSPSRVVRRERKVVVTPDDDAPRPQSRAARGRDALRVETEPVELGEFESRVRSALATRDQRRQRSPR
jgi:hypothetical protein